MAHLQELREKRGQIAAALQAIVARDDYDPAVHSAEYDKGIDELNAVDEQIKRINDLNARLAEDTSRLGLGEAAARRARDQRDPGMAVYAKWLKGGDRALNEDDWATIRNTKSTTTGSEGGFMVPTEVAGSVIKAVVVASDELDAGAVSAFARSRIARFKCPSIVEFVDSLPHSGSGKISKGALRARIEELRS